MADGYIASPKNRILRVGGIKIVGRGKGVYTYVRTVAQISVDVGVDSEGMFLDNGDNSATIGMLLMPGSESNDVMMAFWLARLPVPATLAELNTRRVGGCARAMITKPSDVEWSDGAAYVLWELVTTNWVPYHGGAPPAAVNSTAPIIPTGTLA